MSAGDPPVNSPEIPRLARVIEPGHSYGSVTNKIASIVLTRPISVGWLAGFSIAFTLMMVLMISVAWLITKGVGIWGINIPIGWGFAIVNFVWWIGIGHAGTLISAILFLLNQQWRTSINRFAEAMTLFAVACAGIFPLIHTGRPWMAYYMFPYPSTMGIWPQFRSPLIWDVFAVSTYGTVSLLFWFVGLLPDLATLRDRATNKPAQIIYGMLAMGWRGSARHWHRYQSAYLLLAGANGDAAGVVGSQRHKLRLFDCHRSRLAHNNFPAVFRCRRDLFWLCNGADDCDSAAQSVRPVRLHHHAPSWTTWRKVMLLATGLIVAYGYFFEFFLSLYSGNKFDMFLVQQRLHGPYSPYYYALILCNILTPQLLWVQKMRANVAQCSVRDVAGDQHRHVAGAIRDRSDQLDARFHAERVGKVPADVLGLEHVHRNARLVRVAAVLVCARLAGDIHCGNA